MSSQTPVVTVGTKSGMHAMWFTTTKMRLRKYGSGSRACKLLATSITTILTLKAASAARLAITSARFK